MRILKYRVIIFVTMDIVSDYKILSDGNKL